MKDELLIFNRLADLLLEAEKTNPVIPPIAPEQLIKKLDLSLSEEGISDDALFNSLKEIILSAPRLNTTGFFNQLFGGRNDKASLGDLLVVLLNNTMHTYKVSGPMVGIEKEILKQIIALIGYGDQADGTIAPGGSMTNLMGMIMARDATNDQVRYQGLRNEMVMYASKECHYSVAKNAAFMGIGRDNVRYIDSDNQGKMRLDLLEQAIKKDTETGHAPFMVVATIGTTVMGAADPIDGISKICKTYGLWLHVDGAYCGSVIFSNKYKHLIKGIEKSDSFCVNAHKMLSTPITCSIIITKDKEHLMNSFSNEASYLYQMDGDDYNLGKTSLQCGRRNDALKLWTYWKSVGRKGIESQVDHQFYLAEVARAYIRSNPDYTLYSFDDSVNICFNYKDIEPDSICAGLYNSAELMVGYGIFKEQKFVRLVTINSNNTKADILNFFKVLEHYADQNLI